MQSLLSKLLPQYGYPQPIKRIWENNQTEMFDLGLASSRKTITVELLDGTKLDLFVKTCKAGSAAAEMDKVVMIFQKEIGFYQSLLPQMSSFFERCNKKLEAAKFLSIFPKFFGSGFIGQDNSIFLENIKACCFRETDKESFHSIDMIRASLQALAQFHATSFCMEQMKEVKWLESYSDILLDLMTLPGSRSIIEPIFCGIYQKNLRLLKCVIKEINLGNSIFHAKAMDGISIQSVALEQLETYSNSVVSILHAVQKPLSPFSLVTHGDFHMWNIAFRESEHAQVGMRYDVKFFDFQVVRYSSPLIDIHHYLSQVSTADMRKESLVFLLEEYRKEFFNTVSLLGCALDPKVIDSYSLESLLNEYKRTSPWGFLFGFCWILPRFFGQGEDLAALGELNNSAEVVEAIARCGSVNVWQGFRVICDLIREHHLLGTFDCMNQLKEGAAL